MEQELLTTTKKNGMIYTYRASRMNIMSPKQWSKFYYMLYDKQKPLFDTLLQTGARIMEVLNIQAKDFNFNDKTLLIKTVKQRTRYSDGAKREIKLSTQYCIRMKRHIAKEGLAAEDYLFLVTSKLPTNYSTLPNKEKKKYYEVSKVACSNVFKRKLAKAGLDPTLFSLHNIRKTSESWLCFLNINHLIILNRFGHDDMTALKHYVASFVYDEKYKYEARLLLGDLYL